MSLQDPTLSYLSSRGTVAVAEQSVSGKATAKAISIHNRADYLRATSLPDNSTILLVEDNPADVLLLREALLTHGIKALLFVAHDGDEAIRFVDDIDAVPLACPDLIILDLNLPRKSGFEVLQRVRSSINCTEIPVVILSSSEATKDREQAARLGASQYIRKPSTLKDFMSIGETFKAILAGTD